MWNTGGSGNAGSREFLVDLGPLHGFGGRHEEHGVLQCVQETVRRHGGGREGKFRGAQGHRCAVGITEEATVRVAQNDGNDRATEDAGYP